MHLLDRLKIVRVEQNDEDETLNATAAFIVDTALKMIISKMMVEAMHHVSRYYINTLRQTD